MRATIAAHSRSSRAASATLRPWLIALCRDVLARTLVPSIAASPRLPQPAARASRPVSRNTYAKSSRCRSRKRLTVRKSGTGPSPAR